MVNFGEQLALEFEDRSPDADAADLLRLREASLIVPNPLTEDEDDAEDDEHVQFLQEYLDKKQAVVRSAMHTAMTQKRFDVSEYRRLKPWHIQAVMLKASGLLNKEIARQLGKSAMSVKEVLATPQASELLSVVLSVQAQALPDIAVRLKYHAHEAMNVAVDVMRNSKDENRLKASFKILEMAGYGATKRVENTHELRLPEKQAAALLSTIEHTASPSVDFSRFIEKHGSDPLEIVPEELPEVRSA